MRNFAFAAAAAVLLASGVSAYAAQETRGTVQSVNPAAGTLTLQSGETFQFQNGAQLYGILPGQAVGVTYEGSQGIGAFNPYRASSDNSDAN